MLPLYRTLSWRYLRRRWFWALLVVASITLGVAMLAATQALNRTMVQASRQAANPLAGLADLQVTNGDFGVRRELAEHILQAGLPGVQSARPRLVQRAVLPDLDNRSVLLLGVDAEAERAAGEGAGVELTLKTLPLGSLGPAVFVGSELARQHPQLLGPFRIRVGGQDRRLTGLGTVQAHGPLATLGGSVLVMPLAEASTLLGKPGLVTRIDLTLRPGTDPEAVRQRLVSFLSGEAEVRAPEVHDRAIRDVMAGLEIALQLGGAGALIVGLFLVYNALSVSVAERRHDIGILRAVGATRGQVQALFAGEAGLLGLTGAVLGVPVGLSLAHVALGPMQEVLSEVFMPLEVRRLEITPLLVIGSVLAGVFTAQLAGLVPALQAANEEPADAVRRVPPVAGLVYRLVQLGAVAMLLLVGIGCMALRAWLPPRTGAFGAVVFILLAFMAASPLLTALAARLLRPLARQLFGVEGRLAADNLARSPGRTGLVIAALGVGVALVFQTAGVTGSTEQEVLTWVDESIAADLFVTANSPVSSGIQNLPIDARLGQKLASLPGVEAAPAARFQRLEFRNRLIFLIALDAGGFHDVEPTRSASPRRRQFPELTGAARVLVSDNFAELYRVAPGDSITLRGPRGPVELEVIGTVLDYSWNRGSILVDRGWYREQFGDDLVDVFDVFLRPGVDAEEVRATILRRWGAEEGLVVLTRAELRQRVSDTIRRLYTIPYAQSLVIGLVAGLGVVVALLISVLQRQRELGLLRAVGASQGQVLRTVLAEAVLMGLIGSVIGLLAGLPLEWYAVRVVLFDEAGFLFPVRVPWAAGGWVAGFAVTLATLAGLGPALHAVRLRIPDAIAYE